MSRVFAMILLMALILAGTITMVNLFITVIITSKDKLRQSVLEENLFYMAQSSKMIQYFHKLFRRTNSLTNFNVEGKNTFCVHKFVDQCTTAKGAIQHSSHRGKIKKACFWENCEEKIVMSVQYKNHCLHQRYFWWFFL